MNAAFALALAFSLVACDDRDARRDAVDSGDKKAKAGATKEAIAAYENALDGSAKSAVMYKLCRVPCEAKDARKDGSPKTTPPLTV